VALEVLEVTGDSRNQHSWRVAPCPRGCNLPQRGTTREVTLHGCLCVCVCWRVWRVGLVYGLSEQQPFLVHPPMGGQIVGVDGQPPPPPTDAELALTPGVQGSAANVGMVGQGVVTGMVGGMVGGLASCPLAAKLHKADGIKRCVSHDISSLFSLSLASAASVAPSGTYSPVRHTPLDSFRFMLLCGQLVAHALPERQPHDLSCPMQSAECSCLRTLRVRLRVTLSSPRVHFAVGCFLRRLLNASQPSFVCSQPSCPCAHA
jgi:hypothetical protein